MTFGDWTWGFWLFPLLCVIFMVGMMAMMLRHGGGCMPFMRRHGGRTGNEGESARETLDRRYASGAISKEQYQAIRRDLNQPPMEA